MIEKYTFDLQAPKIKGKLILVKDEMETRAHVVMKLLAYLLYFEPGLKIEGHVDMHYKPDLAVEGDHGIPSLWIDCGHIAIKKVGSIAQKLRRTQIVLIKKTKRELDTFKKVVADKVEQSERVQYLAFDAGFVDGMAESLQRVNQITLYDVMENVIGVTLNDRVFESTLHR
ncbi:MAG: YaeQ family protein [Candidatus Omnitrophica bacterium]|nr:YaeQ family protein [Candidatus Omnitrophota bacterium]